MNPLVVEALGSIIRWGLTLAAGYLVKQGIWTQSNAETYVTAATLALIPLLWSLWQHLRMRLKFVTAAAAAGISEHEVEAMVKDPLVPNPPASSSKAEVPVVPELKP